MSSFEELEKPEKRGINEGTEDLEVSYAVLSFGGFLGIGDDHYPLPWQSLKYDTALGGYVTGVTEAQLQGAPRYGNDNAWNWGDPTRTRAVNDYYGVAI